MSPALHLLLIFLSSTILVVSHNLPGGRHKKHRETECDRCPPEWGLVSLCNASQPSVCRPCQPGTWTPNHPHLKKCESCSRCGPGLYVDESCRPTRDTRCGWCSASKGHFNVDFIRKCLERQDVPFRERSEALRVFYREESQMEEAARRQSVDADPHHRLWLNVKKEMDDFKRASREKVAYKPSYHAYDVSGAMRRRRQKVYILLGTASLMLITTALLILLLLRRFCLRRPSTPHHLYSQLTDLDQQIIRDCAKKLSKEQKTECVEEEWWEDEEHLRITENPLSRLLPVVHGRGICNPSGPPQ